jgi:NAD-dependent deacetylase
MLVIGTSAVVQPAASLPVIAQNHGAMIVEINPERAFAQADYHLAAKAGTVLPLLSAAIDGLHPAKSGRTP